MSGSLNIRGRTTVDAIKRHVHGLTLTRKIKGQTPGSIIEVYTANALDALGVDYFYQFVTYSGNRIVGAVVLDFLVKGPVKWLPIFTDGKEYHASARQRNEDFTKRAILARINRARWWPPLSIPEEELPDQETANRYIKRELSKFGIT